MKNLLFLLILCLITIRISAQNKELSNSDFMPIRVEGIDYKLKNMVIWSLEEDSIELISNRDSEYFRKKELWELKSIDKLMDENRFLIQKVNIKIEDIQLIKEHKVRKRHINILKGVGIGFVLGTGVGLLLRETVDECPEDYDLWCFEELGRSLVLFNSISMGAGLGFKVGIFAPAHTIKISIPIKGKKSIYEKYKNQLKKHSIL